MSKLHEIPIKVEMANVAIANETVCMLLPILHEMVGMLKTLSSSGQGNVLDLRHEPLSLDDIAELKNILGQGEVDANLSVLGKTNIRETNISGVWWITHYNPDGDIINESIEITLCPEILKNSPEDLEPALVRLQDKIYQYQHESTPNEVARRLIELGFSVSNASPSNTN